MRLARWLRLVCVVQALPRVFAMATELLKHHAASPAEGAAAPSTEPCLKLVNAALSWDFTTVSYMIVSD